MGENGERLLLRDAVAADADAVLGCGVRRTHPPGSAGWPSSSTTAPGCRTTSTRRRSSLRWWAHNAKDESYYFPAGVDMGAHPETFFGVHPWIAEQRAYDTLLPYLVDWDSDLILRHARAELLVAGEGFHVPSGVLHAPGTALTLELQEDSDVLAMFQALNAGRIISKELLFKDVRPEDRAEHGERFPLALRRLGAQRRPVVLREPPPLAAR